MGGINLMATFDTVARKTNNFKGYTGNPPTTEAEYDALDCWVDAAAAPSWASISSGIALEAVLKTRRHEYNLLNQDEMRFDDQANSTTTWVDAINAIKAAHPKP